MSDSLVVRDREELFYLLSEAADAENRSHQDQVGVESRVLLGVEDAENRDPRDEVRGLDLEVRSLVAEEETGAVSGSGSIAELVRDLFGLFQAALVVASE